MVDRPMRSKAAALFIAAALMTSSLMALAAEMVLPSEIAVTHWKTRYMNEFAEDVKKRTNGDLIVKVFPAGQKPYNDQDAMAAHGAPELCYYGVVGSVWRLSIRVPASFTFPSAERGLMANRCFRHGVRNRDAQSSYLAPRVLQVLGLLRTADLMSSSKQTDNQKMEDLKDRRRRVGR